METPPPEAARPSRPRSLRLAACFTLLSWTGGWLFVNGLSPVDSKETTAFGLATATVAALVAALLGFWLGRRPSTAPGRWFRFVIATAGAGALTGAILGMGVGVIGVDHVGRSMETGLMLTFYGAILGGILATFCFVPALAVIFGANARVGRARSGSLVDQSDRRRVWFGTAAVIFLIAWIAGGMEKRATGSPKAIAFAATSAVLGLWVLDVAQVTGLFRLLTGLARSDEEDVGADAPAVDLGLGEERWVQTEPREGPYRSTTRVIKVVRGALFDVQRVLTRAALIHAVVLLLVVVAFVRVATRTTPTPAVETPVLPMPPPPPSVATTPVSSQTSPTLSWYPQHGGPIVVDLNEDGTEDVIGLRWDSNHEDNALSVVATDGATFQTLWHTTPLRSQWASPRTHLVKSGGSLFLTDSEGFLHIYDLHDGKERGERVTLSFEGGVTDLCGAATGESRLWLRDNNDWKRIDKGVLVDGAGQITKSDRPSWCRPVERRHFCDEPGSGACYNYRSVKSKEPHVTTSHSFEERDVAVSIGSQGAGALGTYLVGHDPKTQKIRWEHALAFTDDELHADPQLELQLANGRIYGFYQLKTGKWTLGARDGRTGEVVWSREPPRALHGANFVSMTITELRLYLVLNWRVEVFNPTTGESLGVIW